MEGTGKEQGLKRAGARVGRLAGKWGMIAGVTAVFAVLVVEPRILGAFLKTLFPGEAEVMYPRAGPLLLLGEHIVLVLLSSSAATAVGLAVGLFVTRPAGREYLTLANDLSSLAQTIPPVAVLALAVPLIGFGFEPTVFALFLYSMLPVIRNTIAGIESVDPRLIEAASGVGMTRMQILTMVELPLAFRVIMAGIRTSVVINIGTATIGAVVGAGGLGTPIISGLVRENPAFVLEGALIAALLAFLMDQYLGKAEQELFRSYKLEE
jgi:osmoprotectant transport system permease protein